MTQDSGALTIRPATALDAVNIAKLIKYTLGVHAGLARVNDTKAVKFVTETIEHAFVVVAEHMSGRLLGSIAMSPQQQPWSDDWFMGEAWFCVKPSTQSGDAGERLLKEVEKLADARGLPLAFRAADDDFQKITLLNSRAGTRSVGVAFMRQPLAKKDARRAPQESALSP